MLAFEDAMINDLFKILPYELVFQLYIYVNKKENKKYFLTWCKYRVFECKISL